MKRFPILALLLAAGVAGALAPAAKADPVYKRTEVTFGQPVEIPGMVLAPGTYVMELLDPYVDPNIVRFYDSTQHHLYAMVFAARAYRLDPTDKTVITFEERANNAPEAIKDWYYPGDNWGEEFIYPKAHPVQVAATAPAPKRPVQAAVTPAPKPEVKPAPQQPVQVAQAQPAPKPAAPVNPPAPAATEKPKELPKTASDVPLAALTGGLLLLAGALLRRKLA